MNDLMVVERDGKFVVDSREIALMLDKRHDHLLRDIDNYCNILENPTLGNGLNIDVSEFFVLSGYQSIDPSREYKCYLLTKKGCDMVANKMIGEKGVLFTAIYVTKFEDMERQIKVANQVDQYIEMSEEDRAILYFQNKKALRLISQQAEEQTKLIEEMTPKASFADGLMKSKDNLLVREYAKVLQDEGFNLGERKLYTWFKKNKYLMGNKEPYQAYMKYFALIETTFDTLWGTKISKTTKIRPEGQLYFYEKLMKDFNK